MSVGSFLIWIFLFLKIRDYLGVGSEVKVVVESDVEGLKVWKSDEDGDRKEIPVSKSNKDKQINK